MQFLVLIAGFVLMIQGANFFVDGSVHIAKSLKLSPLFIGLTIVAFGTSTPEASVSIVAAINQQSDMSLGNVIGSNLFNILFILGVIAWINPIPVKESIVKREIPFALISSLLLVVFYFIWNDDLSVIQGIILLMIFILFLYMLIKQEKNTPSDDFTKKPIHISILLFLVGLGMIIAGGIFSTQAASKIALMLGMSELLIGLTVLSIGTSLPELITSTVAALKKQNDIAIGNIIGSNIFNVYFILGISSTITPISYTKNIWIDLMILTVITFIVFVFAITNRSISKKEGLVLLFIYLIYMIYIIIRN